MSSPGAAGFLSGIGGALAVGKGTASPVAIGPSPSAAVGGGPASPKAFQGAAALAQQGPGPYESAQPKVPVSDRGVQHKNIRR